jgi:chaperonin GroEL
MPNLRQRVVFQPEVSQGLQTGIHTIVSAVRPTLGPQARIVALENHTGSQTFEFLDEAGVIARRIIQLPDRNVDVGAMLARKAIWQVHDQAGDGAASTAVMFESICDQGMKYVAAGGNAMALRRHLERGLDLILAELAHMTTPVKGTQKLAEFAASLCHDDELAAVLGEIFDIIGEWGRLEIRDGQGRELDREYVEGMYWEGSAFAREMLEPPDQKRVELEDAAVVITDLKVEDPRHIIHLLDVAHGAGVKSLLLIAQSLSPAATSVLLANNLPGKFRVAAAKQPFIVPAKQPAILGDMALLTGGRAIIGDSGETLAAIRVADLGRARRAWVDRNNFGLIGGRGDPKALRRHVRSLAAAYRATQDAEQRSLLRERLGKLLGGSATLYIGGVTAMDIARRKATATRVSEALRGVLREGVVPGGGAALLACRAALRERAARASDPDERMAYRILVRSLEEPTRTIIANAGCDPYEIMALINRAGPGCGFDVLTEQVTPMADAAIWSAASVMRTAVTSAIANAAMALTVEVVVHRDHKFEIEP